MCGQIGNSVGKIQFGLRDEALISFVGECGRLFYSRLWEETLGKSSSWWITTPCLTVGDRQGATEVSDGGDKVLRVSIGFK